MAKNTAMSDLQRYKFMALGVYISDLVNTKPDAIITQATIKAFEAGYLSGNTGLVFQMNKARQKIWKEVHPKPPTPKPNRKTVIALMNLPDWSGTWEQAEQYIIANRRNGKFVMPTSLSFVKDK